MLQLKIDELALNNNHSLPDANKRFVIQMSSNNESLDLNTYIVTKFDIYPMIVLAFLQNKSGSRNIAGKNTESDRKL